MAIIIRGRTVFGQYYEPEISTYIRGLSTPLTTSQIEQLNTFVTTVKRGYNINALSDVYDVMIILAGETPESSLRNLAKRQHDAIAVNSPTFVTYEGYYGNGETQRIRVNYIPYSQGIRYTTNNASLGIYTRNEIVSAFQTDIGFGDVTYNTIINSRYSSYAMYSQLNSTTSQYIFTDGGTGLSLGLNMVTRDGADKTNLSGYRNKALLGSGGSGNTTGIASEYLTILAKGYYGSAESFSTRQISLAFAGYHHTTSMRDILVDAFEVYMDSHGKGVI